MGKVVFTKAPESCRVCGITLLKVYYVGDTWIVDKIVCGKCGCLPLKREAFC